jgi:hypothetical protein
MALLVGTGPALAQTALPDAFYGDWRGVTVEVDSGGDDLEITAEDLSVRIEPDGSGFRMHWTTLTHEGTHGPMLRRPVEARFAPSGRPGVFAFEPEQSSILLSLFGDPSTNNPLKGEPLLWARFADGALSVYGLVINQEGGFDLYQHVRTLTDNGLAVHQVHRTEHGPMVIQGHVERAGG